MARLTPLSSTAPHFTVIFLLLMCGCSTVPADDDVIGSNSIANAKNIIRVDDTEPQILVGKWKGFMRWENYGPSAGEQEVKLKVSRQTDHQIRADFENENGWKWTSPVQYGNDLIWIVAWRKQRPFHLYRVDNGELVLEAEWTYESRYGNRNEALLHLTKIR